MSASSEVPKMDLYSSIALGGTVLLLALGVEIVVCLGLGAVFLSLRKSISLSIISAYRHFLKSTCFRF